MVMGVEDDWEGTLSACILHRKHDDDGTIYVKVCL